MYFLRVLLASTFIKYEMVEGTSFGWFPFSGFSSYPIIFTKDNKLGSVR
jgi:hypothetical protein